MFTWGCHSQLGQTPGQGCCVLCFAHLQHFVTSSTRKQEQHPGTSGLGFLSFEILQAIFLSKTEEKDPVHSPFTLTVSATGRSQQCWSLACPSHPPSHLQLKNLSSAHQGKSPVVQSSVFWNNLFYHWDWGTSIKTFMVDQKKKKYPRVRMSQGTEKSRHKWTDHMKGAHETERRGTGQKSSIK